MTHEIQPWPECPEGKEPYLICPSCKRVEGLPFDEGDECLCGDKFVINPNVVGEFQK